MSARLRAVVAILAAAGALSAPAARAQPLAESVLRVPVHSGDGASGPFGEIDVTVFRPRGEGPFPVVVLSHGSPRLASDRRRTGRLRFVPQSRALVALGYAVVVPTRRGYGESGGEWAEGYGSCREPDYHRAGLETARDIVAALEAVRADPGLDATRIFLMGQSAGGWGSVAAATLPIAGLAGVVNFAGGRGSQAPDYVCGEESLVEAAGRFGQRARAPQLWIYSENDHYFGPLLSRRLYSAFVAGGGRAEYLAAPAVGDDGHGYFEREVADWTPKVGAFLKRSGDEAALRARHATKAP